MEASERRAKLLARLQECDKPLTGTALARAFGVSRQVIVGDIALLRAGGVMIFATPQGYVLPPAVRPRRMTAALACRHGRESVADELTAIVDLGGKILDVIIEHPIYGEIRADLMLGSRRDVREFLKKLEQNDAHPLCLVTGGVHLHTVEADCEAVLADIRVALQRKGILLR